MGIAGAEQLYGKELFFNTRISTVGRKARHWLRATGKFEYDLATFIEAIATPGYAEDTLRVRRK